MTVVEFTRVPEWTVVLVACDLDYKLAAEHLSVTEMDVLRYAVANAEDIAAIARHFSAIEFWQEVRNSVGTYSEATMVKLAEIYSGMHSVTVNNPQQNNFNFGETSPRERLAAEVDGITSRASSNGHSAP